MYKYDIDLCRLILRCIQWRSLDDSELYPQPTKKVIFLFFLIKLIYGLKLLHIFTHVKVRIVNLTLPPLPELFS